MAIARRLIESQIRWSRAFDRLLPAEFLLDGNRDFIDNLTPEYLGAGELVYDIGGGKNPLVSAELKRRLGIKVVGIDIDAGELSAAPPGTYDAIVCADISAYHGIADGDLVICQALLEHVPDTNLALRAIASSLKPGGRALIFVPSRNAVYARLNLLLPQSLKRKVLHGIFPNMRRDQGFPAFYDRCTPAQFERMAQDHGMLLDQKKLYFLSHYFQFCFPLFVAWRAWVLLFRWLAGAEAAETFALVLRKQPQPENRPSHGKTN